MEGILILKQKEKNEKEFAAEKENLMSRIQDLLSENENLIFKIYKLLYENKAIFNHREKNKREVVDILKENIKLVIEEIIIKEILEYKFQIPKMAEGEKLKRQ